MKDEILKGFGRLAGKLIAAVVNDLAKEGTAIDFWSEDDLSVVGNALYECLLDVTSVGENQIVRFVKFVGDAVEIPF